MGGSERGKEVGGSERGEESGGDMGKQMRVKWERVGRKRGWSERGDKTSRMRERGGVREGVERGLEGWSERGVRGSGVREGREREWSEREGREREVDRERGSE